MTDFLTKVVVATLEKAAISGGLKPEECRSLVQIIQMQSTKPEPVYIPTYPNISDPIIGPCWCNTATADGAQHKEPRTIP